MVYSNILVDVFNLYYRVRGGALKNDAITVANHVIDFIENDISKYQDKSKSMYLLFDPIPKKDLGISSSFKYQTTRQKINKDYKANRYKNSQADLEVIELVRKYFSHRGEKYIEVISDMYEADDFVESLVKELTTINKRAMIALYTTDEDWCRYLSDKVEMINGTFSEPFTRDKFYEKYQFYPTICSVVFFKALYGDPSDNITGALMQKKLKKYPLAKQLGFEFIKEISNKPDEKVDDILKRIKGYNFKTLKEDERKTEEVKFFFSVFCTDHKFSFDDLLLQNVKIIRSRCDNYSPYMNVKEPDEKYNDFIEKILNRKKEKVKFRFGGLKG